MRGAPLARRIREDVRARAQELARSGAAARLRVLLVGDDPASRTYVAAKERAAGEAGIVAETIRLSAADADAVLLAAIDDANRDAAVDGLLVQLPLPSRDLTIRVFDRIAPEKDVDGLSPENVGLLLQGRPRFVPCTPAGVMALLEEHGVALRGSRAVVIGRSEIVGKPMAALLTARDATVTVCHSATRALPELTREADILVAAVGRPGFVRGDWIRPGAAVVDVGINRVSRPEELPLHLRAVPALREAIAAKGEVLLGDVATDEAAAVARWITPVPGGVGPLTVAMLLRNTLQAALSRPDSSL
ncbi:MAG: bifunctional 5,10-methylenetetrahydrofolate dehydrogenase/5,10-methenyltetrahydrofolate cyclohydrolase [Thermoanaerobaculia bacterium]